MTARLTDADLDAIRGEISSVTRAGTWLMRALVIVGIGAVIFTMVNVTLFAHSNGVPWFIAWLLDPLASVSLASMLLAQAVLSRHGRRADGWATALMFTAGAATWAMNIWHSVAARDAAGVLLHSVAPALVILIAEATPRLLRQFAELIADLQRKAEAETETRQRDETAAAEARQREAQRLADETGERESAERAERDRQRDASETATRKQRDHEAAQLAGALAAVSLAKRVGKRPARKPTGESKPQPARPKATELDRKRSEHTTTAIDAAILAAWDRGERPVGAHLDREFQTNNYARGRITALRRQYPGREPDETREAAL